MSSQQVTLEYVPSDPRLPAQRLQPMIPTPEQLEQVKYADELQNQVLRHALGSQT